MPKGDNLKGPFKDLPHEAGVIASVKCEVCSTGELTILKPLKVDGHGNLFANCSKDGGCGTKESAHSLISSRALIRKAKNWRAGAKKPAYEIAGILPEKKPQKLDAENAPRRRFLGRR